MLQQMILRTSRYNINNINHRTTHWVRFFGASSAASTVSTSDLKGSNPHTQTQQQRPIRISLPTFGQNGTLLLRNNNSINNNIAKVQIIPQWRDDALIELLPLSISENDENGSSAEQRDYTEIATFSTSTDSSSLETTVQTFGPLQITNHAEGTITSLGRKGSFIEVNILNNDETNECEKKDPMKIVATIPEKSNLTCQLLNGGGDININGKLEGDVHLSTLGGNISVTKLRGHHVTLDTTSTSTKDDNNSNANSKSILDDRGGSCGGVIHIQKAIEAKSVQINTHFRVRARMLNGSQVSINVVREESNSATSNSITSFTKLDDDDEGALIDVGSLYISNGGIVSGDDNEARLFVDDTKTRTNIQDGNESHSRGLVRVKSCHGHVTVHAKTNYQHKVSNGNVSEETQSVSCPLVDIGGVNGSCDITLESSSGDNTTYSRSNTVSNTTMGTRVHFDAMTPESISTITSRGKLGHTSITMDRKLETEVRMLSMAKSEVPLSMPIKFDAHSLTSDDVDEVQSKLRDVSDAIMQQQRQNQGDNITNQHQSNTQSSITIETDAYTSDWGVNALNHTDASGNDDQQQLTLSKGLEYTQGTMTNRSGEPDSRFDIQQQSSRGGKINIVGAASQALHGFRGKKQQQNDENASDSSSSSAAPLPLLAVASDGTITLETLSWFGSIARRYGLEEEKGGQGGVGRQASRLPRLDK